MIETVVALMMFVNNEISEYRYKSDMSECFKLKELLKELVVILDLISVY